MEAEVSAEVEEVHQEDAEVHLEEAAAEAVSVPEVEDSAAEDSAVVVVHHVEALGVAEVSAGVKETFVGAMLARR